MFEDYAFLKDKINEALIEAVNKNLPEETDSGRRMVIRDRTLDRFDTRVEKLTWEMSAHMLRIANGRG